MTGADPGATNEGTTHCTCGTYPHAQDCGATAPLSAEEVTDLRSWLARKPVQGDQYDHWARAMMASALATIDALTEEKAALERRVTDMEAAIREHQENCPDYEEGAQDIDGMPLMVADHLRIKAEAYGDWLDEQREASRRP